MKKIDLGQTINTLANVGVLVGIVFLAIEVSQNQASLEEANSINLIEARDETIQNFRSRNATLLQDKELYRIQLSGDAGDEMDRLDARMYQTLCTDRIWVYAAAHARTTALGMAPIPDAAVSDMSSLISSNPGFRQCWNRVKGSVTAWGVGDFVASVERMLQ
jgi:hypothetical protein